MNASPGGKDYGSLPYWPALPPHRNYKKGIPVSFIPRPKVDSIVIKLRSLDPPRVEVEDEKLFLVL